MGRVIVSADKQEDVAPRAWRWVVRSFIKGTKSNRRGIHSPGGLFIPQILSRRRNRNYVSFFTASMAAL